MKPLEHDRLFEKFIDPVDGVICLSAESNVAAINQETASHGLRFPLILDNAATISEQISASGYATASSRFGPYWDNITGMNWMLPDGRKVRVGERVVKSTTGYDLLRFLLRTGTRFGRPLDYVLRLRPACDCDRSYYLKGSPEKIEIAASYLIHSCYIHWMESVDWTVDSCGEEPVLRVVVHSPASEITVFDKFLSQVAQSHDLKLESVTGESIHLDGCPDLVVKTTPENVIRLAKDIAKRSDIRCVALCASAVIHVYFPTESQISDKVTGLIEPFAASLHVEGGDWHSRHVLSTSKNLKEVEWIKKIQMEWMLPT